MEQNDVVILREQPNQQSQPYTPSSQSKLQIVKIHSPPPQANAKFPTISGSSTGKEFYIIPDISGDEVYDNQYHLPPHPPPGYVYQWELAGVRMSDGTIKPINGVNSNILSNKLGRVLPPTPAHALATPSQERTPGAGRSEQANVPTPARAAEASPERMDEARRLVLAAIQQQEQLYEHSLPLRHSQRGVDAPRQQGTPVRAPLQPPVRMPVQAEPRQLGDRKAPLNENARLFTAEEDASRSSHSQWPPQDSDLPRRHAMHDTLGAPSLLLLPISGGQQYMSLGGGVHVRSERQNYSSWAEGMHGEGYGGGVGAVGGQRRRLLEEGLRAAESRYAALIDDEFGAGVGHLSAVSAGEGADGLDMRSRQEGGVLSWSSSASHQSGGALARGEGGLFSYEYV